MASPSSALVAMLSAASLGVLLAISPPARGASVVSPSASGAAGRLSVSAYARDVTTLLTRYDFAQGDGDRLLTERDADPRLVGDAGWRQSYARVASEHQREYAEIQTLAVPANAQTVQDCVTDGLRLTATADGMFLEAFTAEGHRAYYLSAHGNWDLNLGKTTIVRCRASFAAWQTKAGA